MKVTPSLVKKVKMAEKKMIKREEEAWKVFQAQRISMPVRIHERELEKGIFKRVKDYSFLVMILR